MLRKIFFYPALFILSWIYAVKFNDVDYDFWARIAAGKIFLQTGSVVQNDIFSYTLTKQWIDHEWGSGVIFYYLTDTFGDVGLIALKIILMFTIMLLISKIIELQNPKPDAHRNILFYLLIVLGTFFGIAHTVRCQLFTFTLFTLCIYILERVRREETRLLWIFPAIMLIWANLHGGFIAGLGLLFMYGVGEFLNKKPSKQYFLTLLPASLVTLINPYGVKYLIYIFYATTMNRKLISEWQNTELFHSFQLWYALKLFIIMSVISLIFYFIKKRPKFFEIDKVKFILLAVTLYLALSHIKHQSFFVITAACFIYHDFYYILEQISSRINKKFLHILDLIKNALVYTVLLGGGMLLMIYTPIFVKMPINKFPVLSVEFIRQNNIKGNLASVFHWGSYIAWKLYPNCFIALDGRFEEVYPEETFYLGYQLIYHKNAPEKKIFWTDLLKKYDTDIILAEKTAKGKNQTYKKLKTMKEWKMIYEDPISAVFIRKELAKNDYIKPVINVKTLTTDKFNTDMDFASTCNRKNECKKPCPLIKKQTI